MIDRRTLLSVVLLTVIAMGLLLQLLLVEESREARKVLERKGYSFTNLLALHKISEYKDDRRGFLLRSFLEHPLFQDLAYFYIHSSDGTPIIALGHSDLRLQVPVAVSNRAIGSMGFQQQSFHTDDDMHFFEFSKAVVENGVKAGTIRLGLFEPKVTIFTLERVSLMALMAFFIFAGAIIAYYGFSKTLVTLSRLKTSLFGKQTDGHAAGDPIPRDAATIKKDLIESLQQVKEYLGAMEEKNTELTSRIGLVQFEKEQIGKILDTIRLGIIITDINANVVHMNAYVLNLLGLQQSESLDRPLDEIIDHPKALEFLTADSASPETGGETGIDIEWRDLAPGETYHLTRSFLCDSNDRPSGKMILLRNITREKAMEQATRDFTAHLSHELLTPLTTIQSYSEMLVDDEIEETETRNEFYNTIYEETERLSRLIKDILTFSRLENGNMTIEKGLVRSDWLYNDSLAAINGSALKKGITVEKILPDNNPSLIGDKEQLKGAIINILGNAVKYTPEGGTIRFELSEKDEMVAFDIHDTGCGIAQDEQPHIFTKFFRSKNSAVAEQPGTGLGLAIAHEIVMLHEGKLTVESQFGQGSQFTIKIPKEEYYLEK
ncbi:MAG: ATP-binding protein [Desulfobacteraceae bacterium]|jgi:signal transduction histidine kinase